MRVALVVPGLPPFARSGVETHAEALANALALRGCQVEVFAPRSLPGLEPLAQRREQRSVGAAAGVAESHWAVTWYHAPEDDEPEEEERADAFAAFLDRERPEVVHFEELASVGLRAVAEARGRGIPTVYCAHDWSAVSDRPTLLQPDGRPIEPGDREVEARCLLARRYLAGLSRRVGEHDLVLSEELREEEWSGLQEILSGERELEGLDDARQSLRERAERRRRAFIALDARFAASRYLARKLSGTLGRAVDWRPAGIDLARFEHPDASRGPRGALRFGFMGSVRRREGVHLLLEAYSELDPTEASLVIHGDSDERGYLRRMRHRAMELGADWGGPYRAEDAAELLEDLDVLVLPTLWSANPPFEIQQSYAARRPVIAPRTEAFAEALRDDVDGLLFDQGDVRALARAMGRFVAEEFLHDRFEMELVAPRSIEAEAEEWIETYRTLIEGAAARRTGPRLPAHLEQFSERYRELSELPTHALFGQVVNGLGALGAQMG